MIKNSRVQKPLQDKHKWPKHLRLERDEYICKLYQSDLFDRLTIAQLIKDRYGKEISLITVDRAIKENNQ